MTEKQPAAFAKYIQDLEDRIAKLERGGPSQSFPEVDVGIENINNQIQDYPWPASWGTRRPERMLAFAAKPDAKLLISFQLPHYGFRVETPTADPPYKGYMIWVAFFKR